MIITLNDFQVKNTIYIAYRRQSLHPNLNDYIIAMNIDLMNPKNLTMSFMDYLANDKKNKFYFKVKQNFPELANEDEASLYMLFFPFFKHPDKFCKNNVYEYKMEDVHKQLTIMSKIPMFKINKDLLRDLDLTFGVLHITKNDLLQFAEDLKST